MNSLIRAFIRHPVDVPIELSEPVSGRSPVADIDPLQLRARNISSGGVSLLTDKYMSPNSIIQLSIRLVKPPFETYAQVVWCEALESRFELGLQFMRHQDEFAARMVEQVCHIEHYRMWVQEVEGRDLDCEHAAEEWIGKFAQDFPNIGG